MTTYQVCRSPEDTYRELQRAKYKIRCLLRDKEEGDALIEELQREKIVLKDVNVRAVSRTFEPWQCIV